jgi:hypothetical protein
MDELLACSSVDGTGPLARRPQRGGGALDRLAALRPDFLVISPPKTGSTWLADNLRRHPEVFVPGVKEIKYFSCYLKAFDLGWYLDHFAPAAGRVMGEASPCYALLPVERIRLIRRLMPDVKLVFLMRAPVARAWSHARHNHRYGEANFAPRPSALESVTDDQWRANFVHDWPVAGGDYLGQLRRWLAVFPREQMYVGFYESIAAEPAALLRDIFAFLGVDPDVDLSAFPVSERILPGPPLELPARLDRFLHRLLHDRTAELAGFLRERFGLTAPAEWRSDPNPAADPSPPEVPAHLPAFRCEFDDEYLSWVLDQPATFRSAYRLLEEDYLGYRVVYWRGRLFAVARSVAHIDPREADEAALKRLQDAGDCFIASTLAEIKERLALHVAHRSQTRLESVEADLLGARERLSRLEGALGEAIGALRRLEADALRLSAKEHALVQALRTARWALLHGWRRLPAVLAGGFRREL